MRCDICSDADGGFRLGAGVGDCGVDLVDNRPYAGFAGGDVVHAYGEAIAGEAEGYCSTTVGLVVLRLLTRRKTERR